MAAKTIIEINGRKYDALTGRIVEGGEVLADTKINQVTPTAKTGVIDGIQKPKQKLHSSISPQPQSRKKTQKSQTLARNIVKKPAPTSVPKTHKATGPSQPNTRSLSVAETRRIILSKAPAGRQERAKSTKQSVTIARFATTDNVTKPVVTQHIIVAREQVALASPLPSAPPITTKTGTSSHPTQKQSFTHPLAGANAHLAAPPKKRRLHQKAAEKFNLSSKMISVSAACLAVIMLASFFAYQKVPNISMRVAASRAGFAGTVPATTPAGYAFNGPITYEKDVIVVKYKSNSDDRQFQIVQRPTSWNSDGLLKNYVAGTNMRYQTYNDRGLTVYVMDKNNAAWVNKGIWYTLSGTNTLSTEQVLAMAASM